MSNTELIAEGKGYRPTTEAIDGGYDADIVARLTAALESAEGLVAHLKGEGREHGAWEEMKRQRDAALALNAAGLTHIHRMQESFAGEKHMPTGNLNQIAATLLIPPSTAPESDASVTSCQIPIWDGGYRMPCGYMIVSGKCVRHGKAGATS